LKAEEERAGDVKAGLEDVAELRRELGELQWQTDNEIYLNPMNDQGIIRQSRD
jgi:hypothetical protein